MTQAPEPGRGPTQPGPQPDQDGQKGRRRHGGINVRQLGPAPWHYPVPFLIPATAAMTISYS